MKPLQNVMYEIVDKQPSNYYVFSGPEGKVISIYIDKICELGYDKTFCESVEQAVKSISSNTMFRNKCCYIIIDDNDYLKKDNQWEHIKERFEKSGDILIIWYNKLDKRSKMYKSNYHTEFELLSEDLLVSYVLKDFPQMSHNLAEQLVMICERDYSRILYECNKIRDYMNANNAIETADEAFYELINQNVIYQPTGDITYKFIDCVTYGDLDNSYKLLHKIKLSGESPLGILALLYINFKNLLLYQGLGKDKSDAERRTGLTKWQISNAAKVIGGYKTIELRNILDYITEIEQGIKLGLIEEDVAIDYALIKIMG